MFKIIQIVTVPASPSMTDKDLIAGMWAPVLSTRQSKTLSSQ